MEIWDFIYYFFAPMFSYTFNKRSETTPQFMVGSLPFRLVLSDACISIEFCGKSCEPKNVWIDLSLNQPGDEEDPCSKKICYGFPSEQGDCNGSDSPPRRKEYSFQYSFSSFHHYISIPIKNHIKSVEIEMKEFRAENPFTGLFNLGATCYINSLLQTMYHMQSFKKYLYSREGYYKLLLSRLFYRMDQINLKEASENNEEYSDSIGAFIRNLTFVESVNYHQDVHEFSKLLFDRLETEDKAIKEIVEGEITSVIECSCGCECKTKEPFQDIQLQLTDGMKRIDRIEDSLKLFCTAETIDGFRCEKHGPVGASKKLRFSKLPGALFVLIKRFVMDWEVNECIKDNDYYEFGESLDLSDYIYGASAESRYKLYSVIVHSGIAEEGHYYCYLKLNDKYYKFDDGEVTETIKEEALDWNFGGKHPFKSVEKSFSAYYLVYLKESEGNNLDFDMLSKVSMTSDYNKCVNEKCHKCVNGSNNECVNDSNMCVNASGNKCINDNGNIHLNDCNIDCINDNGNTRINDNCSSCINDNGNKCINDINNVTKNDNCAQIEKCQSFFESFEEYKQNISRHRIQCCINFLNHKAIVGYKGPGPFNTSDYSYPQVSASVVACAEFDNVSKLIRGKCVFDSNFKLVKDGPIVPDSTYFVYNGKKEGKLVFIKVFHPSMWCTYPSSLQLAGMFPIGSLQDLRNFVDFDSPSIYREKAFSNDSSNCTERCDGHSECSNCTKCSNCSNCSNCSKCSNCSNSSNSTKCNKCSNSSNSTKCSKCSNSAYKGGEGMKYTDDPELNSYIEEYKTNSYDTNTHKSSNTDLNPTLERISDFKDINEGDVLIVTKSGKELETFLNDLMKHQIVNVTIGSMTFPIFVRRRLSFEEMEETIQDCFCSREIRISTRPDGIQAGSVAEDLAERPKQFIDDKNRIYCSAPNRIAVYLGIISSGVDVNLLDHIHVFLLPKAADRNYLLKKFRLSKFVCMNSIQGVDDLQVVETFKDSLNARILSDGEPVASGGFVLIQKTIKRPIKVCFYSGSYKPVNYPFFIENPGTIRNLRDEYFFVNNIVKFDGYNYASCGEDDALDLKPYEVLLIEKK